MEINDKISDSFFFQFDKDYFPFRLHSDYSALYAEGHDTRKARWPAPVNDTGQTTHEMTQPWRSATVYRCVHAEGVQVCVKWRRGDWGAGCGMEGPKSGTTTLACTVKACVYLFH